MRAVMAMLVLAAGVLLANGVLRRWIAGHRIEEMRAH
jgi:hypothetical protein